MDAYSPKIIPILKQFGVRRASLFGSVARGEDTDKSDIDILIEPPEKLTLFGLARIKNALEKTLNKSVDIVTFNSVHPLLKKYVLADQKSSMIKDNSLFLTHILTAIEAIEEYIYEIHTKEDFIASRKTKDAVLRNFEIIGEAASNLEATFVVDHPEIVWSEIIAMRNIIIHEYFGVDMNLVWDTIVEDLPVFKAQIKKLLTSFSTS